MIEVHGGAFDLCGLRLGSRLGPAAVRLAGLAEALEALDLTVVDCGDVGMRPAYTCGGGLRNFKPLKKCLTELRARTFSALQNDKVPLLLGGEHTIAAAGVGAALQKFNGSLGLLWIDAHADINTPGTSTTGNIHGMPLAALAGLPSETTGRADDEWRELVDLLVVGSKLNLDTTVWFGLRDVDRAERAHLRGHPITMHDIDRIGVVDLVEGMDRWWRKAGIQQIWISFDVDALDPVLAPGTGTGVRGGLTYREAHLTAELLREKLDRKDCPYRLVGADVVETNPLFDSCNETAKMAVEWLSSLFGKTILGTR